MRFWSTPYHPARAFLFERGLYVLLACDAWLLMIEHGARYAVGAFNVAHFDWLDRLIPLPSPALYVGLVSASGLLALSAACFEVSALHKLLLALLYTLSWAISMHDSYQHHYLLSWLLLYCVLFPRVRSRQAAAGRPLPSAPGLPLATLGCAVVYLFTAVSKSEVAWRSGHVLQSLSHAAGGRFDPFGLLPRLLQPLGVPESVAFQLMALGVLSVQLLVAAGYALCTLRDDSANPWFARLCSAAWLASVVFHVLTELDVAFSIGLFSYYMLWFGLVAFAPGRLLQHICSPFAQLQTRIDELLQEQTPSLSLLLGGSCLLTIVLAQSADLPGVPLASGAVLVWFALHVGYFLLRREPEQVLRHATMPVVAMLGLLAALNIGSVRFDYYRRAAGELTRMGALADALAMYRMAERHAPAGKTRMSKIDKLQRALEQTDAGARETGDP